MKTLTSKEHKSINKIELTRLAKEINQLQRKNGLATGQLMHLRNKNMTLASINALQLENKNRVLEIGHGNCTHLKDVFNKNSSIFYFGLETSTLMKQEAEQNNKKYIKNRQAVFQNYTGDKIPYVFNFFDKIMTVNTIYYWNNPQSYLNELYRVLKPNGHCVVSFVNGDFMEKLPFINPKFSYYNSNNLKELVSHTNFKIFSLKTKKELVKNQEGKTVLREYSIAVLKK